MEKPFSLTNTRNDQQTTENEEKFERSILSNPLVDHPKSHEGNPFFTRRTSLDSEWEKKKKPRSVDSPCSSFLVLVKSLLHMVIALAIILSGSPVLVGGSVYTERVTLQAGQPAVIPFDIPRPPDNISQAFPHYILGFVSEPRPFCINGEYDIEGFKSPSQFPRFTISKAEMASSFCVKVNIDPVDIVDEDMYVLQAFYKTFDNLRQVIVRKEVLVRIVPPGPAKCFITMSENNNYPYEAHCRATTGSMKTTITCYQYGQRVEVKGDVTDLDDHVTREVFLLPDHTLFSCCSHHVTSEVNVKMCNDFEWSPNEKSITQARNDNDHVNPVTRPASINQICRPAIGHTESTVTPPNESHMDSGAPRHFLFCSDFGFTYPFIFLVYFSIM